MRKLLLVLAILVMATSVAPSVGANEDSVSYFDGQSQCINLSGLEFGEDMPGTQDRTYTSPVHSMAYFAEQGFDLIRLPIQSERLEAPGYMELIGESLDEAERLGLGAVLDMRNNTVRDGGGITAFDLLTYWEIVLNEYAEHPALVGVGLLNEPNRMDAEWNAIAQEVVTTIQEMLPSRVTVLVPGNEWSTALHWPRHSRRFGVTSTLPIKYEAHQYLDAEGAGNEYDETLPDEMLGVERVTPLLEWLEDNNVEGFLGEIGVRQDSEEWFVALDNTLQTLEEAGVTACLWAGGPWWGDYPLSLEPQNGQHAPLIAHLISTGWLMPRN